MQTAGRGKGAEGTKLQSNKGGCIRAEIFVCTAVASMHVLGLFSSCSNGLLETLHLAQSHLRGTAPRNSLAEEGGQGSTGQDRDPKDGL